ncbi:uncharacterized protein LOC129407204 [Boleophthalmus pectinirostris]|uniref:uncharacterized protein LOC129407204 n=1 Tax=Boleophthalmus pectinirostris TaxID=150288 RepID=UPI00242EAC66|nr:uncharacterized protein LOC129407204 [Boleophthalmus pectinirostris]
MDLSDETASALDVDLSSMLSELHITSHHLVTRHQELATWQSLTALGIQHVGQEVDALERLKLDVEAQLEDRQTYARFIAECVKFKEDFGPFVCDDVYAELKNEKRLTNQIISTLRNHIDLLYGQIDSLKDIHNHLYTNFQDKSEATEIMAGCMTHTNSLQISQTGRKQRPLSYDQWKSECDKMQNTCQSLLRRSASLRQNVQFTLTNLRNACGRQWSSTNRAMRRRTHDMRKKEEQTRWKLQHAQNEMDELQKTLWKVMEQMRNCEARACENANNIDALNKRKHNELCNDQAHNSLMLQKYNLSSIATGLERMHRQVHAKLEVARRCVSAIQRELEEQGRALQAQCKCQDMYQNILPLHGASV